jgi:hypothetical protein
MAMKLEGGERLVLKCLLDLQGTSNAYVEDAKVAAATKLAVPDVRDWLETLDGKEFVERTRLTDGFSAYVTAKGKQALRLTEPISGPKPTGDVMHVNAASSGSTTVPPSQPAETQKLARPIPVFYAYSHKDESLREELEEHLALLKRQGYITGWNDRRIGAGDEWKGQLDKNLDEGSVILLLVSASFLASDYCYDIETKRAVDRHNRGDARVIPIILRPCDWHEAPFGKLQALPKDGKAVTSWANKDEAWTDIAKGIRRAVEAMTVNPR